MRAGHLFVLTDTHVLMYAADSYALLSRAPIQPAGRPGEINYSSMCATEEAVYLTDFDGLRLLMLEVTPAPLTPYAHEPVPEEEEEGESEGESDEEDPDDDDDDEPFGENDEPALVEVVEEGNGND